MDSIHNEVLLNLHAIASRASEERKKRKTRQRKISGTKGENKRKQQHKMRVERKKSIKKRRFHVLWDFQAGLRCRSRVTPGSLWLSCQFSPLMNHRRQEKSIFTCHRPSAAEEKMFANPPTGATLRNNFSHGNRVR